MLESFNWIGKNISMNLGMMFISFWKILWCVTKNTKCSPYEVIFLLSSTGDQYLLRWVQAPAREGHWNRAQPRDHLGSHDSDFLCSCSSFSKKFCTLSLKQEASTMHLMLATRWHWSLSNITWTVTAQFAFLSSPPHLHIHKHYFFTFITIVNLKSMCNFTHSHPSLLRRKHGPYLTNCNLGSVCSV